jgi:tmRNA-binding protein
LNFGIGTGKKLYDKRRDIAKKEADRKIEIALKEKQK